MTVRWNVEYSLGGKRYDVEISDKDERVSLLFRIRLCYKRERIYFNGAVSFSPTMDQW